MMIRTGEDDPGQVIENGVTERDQTHEKRDVGEGTDHGQESAQVPERRDDTASTAHVQESIAGTGQEVHASQEIRTMTNVEKAANTDQKTAVDRDHHTEIIQALEDSEVERPGCCAEIAKFNHQ